MSRNEITKDGQRREVFLVFSAPIGFVFTVRPAIDLERVIPEGCLTLPAFVVTYFLSSVRTAGLPGWTRHEGCSTHTTFTETYSTRAFLFQVMVKNLADGCSTMAPLFAVTRSLHNMAAVKNN